MSKAVVHLDNKQVTKISKLAIGVDKYSRAPNKLIMRELSRISDQMTGMGRGHSITKGSIADLTNKAIGAEFSSAVNTVQAVLTAGIHGAKSGIDDVGGVPVSWQPLSKDWIAHKRRSSKDKFWRNTGDLAIGFHGFSAPYLRRVATESFVEITARRKTYGKPFMYEIKFGLPAHQKFNVLNTVLAEAFLDAEDKSHIELKGYGSRDGHGYTNLVVGFLEGYGTSNRYRPFISKLMQARGYAVESSLMRYIWDADAKINRGEFGAGSSLTFRLKS